MSLIKTSLFITGSSCIFFIAFFSCNNGSSSNHSISSDSAVIAQGKSLFYENCASCHNMEQNGIGPKLAGVTSSAPADWLQNYIANPQEVINAGDERASALFKEYKTIMPPFSHLGNEKINALIAFLNTHQGSDKSEDNTNPGIKDPIPETIKYEGLEVELQEVAQFPSSSTEGNKPLARITKLDYAPGSNDLYVNDLNGRLYKMKDGKPVVYLDMTTMNPKFINKPGLATGLGSFAFHPEFAKNNLLYITHTETGRSQKAEFSYPDSVKATVQWVLTEWKAKNISDDHFSGTKRELLRVDMVSPIHGVQEITFNSLSKPGDEDYGLLYIAVGDGGCVENGYPVLAESKEKIWGTVLRINPLGNNSGNGKYGIPKNNPFAHQQNNAIPKEIFAYGFRNPHRITWDQRGQMLVCNIGQHHIESVNLIKPGNDYGWPIREGRFVIDTYGDINNVYPLPANDSIYKITYPVAAFDHDEGVAITGGLEYWGNTIPLLKGKYLFGDIPSGRLFYLNTADIQQGKLAPISEWRVSLNNKPVTLTQTCGSNRADLHFGRDAKGELYLMTKADGKLYKIINAKQNPI